MDTIARINALLNRDILPNTRADLAAFKAAASAGTLDADDERYICRLYERLCSGVGAQPSQRNAWPAAFDRPSLVRRMEPEAIKQMESIRADLPTLTKADLCPLTDVLLARHG